jgi:cell shape-determining protein MreD
MNWLIFILITYLFLLMQTGLTALLGMPDAKGVSPDFLLILAVYVGLLAPAKTVAWSMLAIGIIANLLPGPIPQGPILGPEALGYLAGAFAVIQLRTLVFRESVITLAIMVFVVGIFIQLVTVALYTTRGLPFLLGDPVPAWSASRELVDRFLMLLYSAAVAVPLGIVLIRLRSAFNFTPGQRSERVY